MGPGAVQEFCTNFGNIDNISSEMLSLVSRGGCWRGKLQHRQIPRKSCNSRQHFPKKGRRLWCHTSLGGGRVEGKGCCRLPLPMGKYLECLEATGPMPKSSPEMDNQPTSAICRKTRVSGEDTSVRHCSVQQQLSP